MNFLKNNHRFSFLLDGKPALESAFTVETQEQENELQTVYRFACGLTVTNLAKKYVEGVRIQ